MYSEMIEYQWERSWDKDSVGREPKCFSTWWVATGRDDFSSPWFILGT